MNELQGELLVPFLFRFLGFHALGLVWAFLCYVSTIIYVLMVGSDLSPLNINDRSPAKLWTDADATRYKRYVRMIGMPQGYAVPVLTYIHGREGICTAILVYVISVSLMAYWYYGKP